MAFFLRMTAGSGRDQGKESSGGGLVTTLWRKKSDCVKLAENGPI